MRKPYDASHADTSTPEARQATANELRHVADLVSSGLIEIRNSTETALADGWDRLTFDRKLHDSLN